MVGQKVGTGTTTASVNYRRRDCGRGHKGCDNLESVVRDDFHEVLVCRRLSAGGKVGWQGTYADVVTLRGKPDACTCRRNALRPRTPASAEGGAGGWSAEPVLGCDRRESRLQCISSDRLIDSQIGGRGWVWCVRVWRGGGKASLRCNIASKRRLQLGFQRALVLFSLEIGSDTRSAKLEAVNSRRYTRTMSLFPAPLTMWSATASQPTVAT